MNNVSQLTFIVYTGEKAVIGELFAKNIELDAEFRDA